MYNILFVEDEELAQLAILGLARERGWTVNVAETADKAVEHLRTKRYDLIILDVMIPPGMELKGTPFREAGKELAIKLRRGQVGLLRTPSDVPILAVTAVSDIRVLRELDGAGNVTILNKPIDAADVVAEAERVLAGP
jgi:CheY-like chemotaxis protein